VGARRVLQSPDYTGLGAAGCIKRTKNGKARKNLSYTKKNFSSKRKL